MANVTPMPVQTSSRTFAPEIWGLFYANFAQTIRLHKDMIPQTPETAQAAVAGYNSDAGDRVVSEDLSTVARVLRVSQERNQELSR